MYVALHCYLARMDDGEVRANVRITDDGVKRGLLRADHYWTACPPGDDTGPMDDTVAVALACSALGSRLLRLAEEIHAQRPLFTVRDMGRVDF